MTPTQPVAAACAALCAALAAAARSRRPPTPARRRPTRKAWEATQTAPTSPAAGRPATRRSWDEQMRTRAQGAERVLARTDAALTRCHGNGAACTARHARLILRWHRVRWRRLRWRRRPPRPTQPAGRQPPAVRRRRLRRAGASRKPDETNAAAREDAARQQRAVLARRARVGQAAPGYTSLPGAEKGVLIQRVHAVPRLALHHRRRSLAPGAQPLDHPVRRRAAADRAGGDRRCSTWRKGPLGGDHPDSGRKIERFTPFERAAHWTNAIAFVVLAISGIVMAFGKFFLLPVIGRHAVRLADLRAEDGAQLRRAAVRGVAAGRHRHVRARQLPQRGDWRLAAQGRRHARAATRCRRTASTPARRSCSGAACSARPDRRSARAWCSTSWCPGIDYTRGDMQVAHMVHAVGDGADDGAVPRPHLPRHDRHAGRVHARCAPAMSTRTGRSEHHELWCRRHRGRQDPGAALGRAAAAAAGRPRSSLSTESAA